MSHTLIEEKAPLPLTPDGIYRVEKTRVPLDIVFEIQPLILFLFNKSQAISFG